MDPEAFAVEANLAEWVLAKAACLEDVEVHREADVSWTFTRKSVPENTAMLAQFKDPEVGVARILNKSLEQKSACNWITGPFSQPHLDSALRQAGFHCRIHCAGMFSDLSSVPAQVSQPRGAHIAESRTCPPFEPLTTERRQRAQSIRDALAAAEPRHTWHFVATLDKRTVGRTTLFVGAGVAGVYDVEVLKHARYRGIGTSLVHAALQHAVALGHRHAVLTATGAGFGVYARLGFREVAKISFWRYGKMRQQ